MCNLTELIVRPEDTFETLKEKVEIATILGTIQSSLTDFKYLRKIWRDNCEEERLLGVSMTGITDNKWLVECEGSELEKLKNHAIRTNETWADYLGINRSTAITCVKPSGTVSQLCGTASGIHPRWAHYYLRSVRNDVKDPLTQLLIAAGIPHEPDQRNPNAVVFYFPQKAPSEALVRDDLSAIQNLELWKKFQLFWCEHKPSITVNVKEEEWIEVAAWCYENFDILSGVAFLPYDPTTYPQAPYMEITEEEYNDWVAKMPAKVEWGDLPFYEFEDSTTGSQELACTAAGGCEFVGSAG